MYFRYDELLMYDVQGNITCGAFLNGNKLLLTASGDNRRHEVWELSIPKKLVAGKDAGLTKDRDFKIITAGYSGHKVKQMITVESAIIISELNGVHHYAIPKTSAETDIISCTKTLRQDIQDASLALNDSEVYSGTAVSNIQIYDLNSDASRNLSLDVHCGSSPDEESSVINELSVKNNKIYIGLMNKGQVLVYDTRQTNSVSSIKPPIHSSGRWTLDVSNDGTFISTLDATGIVNVYDHRKIASPVFKNFIPVQETADRESNSRLIAQFSPCQTYLSTSGIDKKIHVFDFRNEGKDSCVFCHDGHRNEETRSITMHIWHPQQENLVFSADNSGQLQAWKFKQTWNCE
ncbi:hypothetical protein SK128_012707 [Halocaridina rubra]|uniref:Uncharacterized protein n=1 Tax=Halocaridina rubra TaxID=373956 RepID=A0AAN8WX47_HALRR